MAKRLFGGIEGGGTKFICAVGADARHILAETRIETTSPAETLRRATRFSKSRRNASANFPPSASPALARSTRNRLRQPMGMFYRLPNRAGRT